MASDTKVPYASQHTDIRSAVDAFNKLDAVEHKISSELVQKLTDGDISPQERVELNQILEKFEPRKHSQGTAELYKVLNAVNDLVTTQQADKDIRNNVGGPVSKLMSIWRSFLGQ